MTKPRKPADPDEARLNITVSKSELTAYLPGKDGKMKISEAARAMGRKGGKSTSKAKQAASRENGKRGGAPLKPLKELSRSGLWRRKKRAISNPS